MPKSDAKQSRRGFLSNTGKLALAATAAASLRAAPARAEDPAPNSPGHRKRIIPGSPSKAYSRAVQLDRMVFVAGCVGLDNKTTPPAMPKDFMTQAFNTLQNLKASVEASGSRLENVLKCTCFLKNLANFKEFNDTYMKFFKENPPARSTVVVKDFVVEGAMLEVDCVCYVE
jgi:2-iminobutanoate/2-iminopropanoate deaminase